MEKTYVIRYEHLLVTEVIIDEEKAAEHIKAMVEFWSGWQERVEDAEGDYTRVWLKDLGVFILDNRRAPDIRDEGWCRLDGFYGIKVKFAGKWTFDPEDVWVDEKDKDQWNG